MSPSLPAAQGNRAGAGIPVRAGAAFALALLCPAPSLRAAPLPIAPAGREMLNDSIKEVPATAASLAPHRVRDQLRSDELSKTMGFVVSLRIRNFAELQARVQNGERISQREMEAKYLPFRGDFARVSAWLLSQGLEMTMDDPNHTNVFVHGTVAKVSAALGVNFSRVVTGDGEFTSAVTAPSLPADLARVVLGIDGLQPHILMHVPKPRLDVVTNVSGLVTPADLLAGYNVPGNLNGNGQTIAIIMSAAPLSSDLTTFWTNSGITRPGSATYTLIDVNDGSQTGPTEPNGADGEVAMDAEWSTGMAPGASLRVYATPSLSYYDLMVACELVINDGGGSTICSYSAAGPEEFDTLSSVMGNSQQFALMASAGITMLASSGDSGSNPNTTGTNGYAPTNAISVMYPASDPDVAGIGGTTPTFDASWNMISEAAWSEIPFTMTNPNATGGGVSTVFTKPAWQTGGSLLAGETMRCVPDVSAMSTAIETIGMNTYGTGAYVELNGSTNGEGGTSLASPMWAGMAAILNQALVNSGRANLGLLMPHVYPLLGTSSFNDITSGNNGAYNAVAGYDLCTGIGTPNIGNIILQIAPIMPVDNTLTGAGAFGSNIDGSYDTANGFDSLAGDLSGSQDTAVGFKAIFTDTTGSFDSAIGVQALLFDTSGADNTAAGSTSLYNNATGAYNTALGYGALYFNAASNNTATGYRALLQTTYGTLNTADGVQALASNTTGTYNTAVGAKALYSNVSAGFNTATGYASMYFDTGSKNTADGFDALLHNTTGANDTAVGSLALFTDTTDSYLVAVGYEALYVSNGAGNGNTAFGAQSLAANAAGSEVVAVGYQALNASTADSLQTAIGYQALFSSNAGYGYSDACGYQALQADTTGYENVAVGYQALGNNTTGSINIAFGAGAGSALASNNYLNIDVGSAGQSGDEQTTRIGTQGTQTAAYIAGIAGATASGGAAVYINPSTGQLGTMTSSQRFKRDIQDMGSASEAILALRPVTFRYKEEIDPKALPQYGLIAEEVEKVSPDLVVYDADHRAYSVRYEAVNAMLLNEFHKQNDRLAAQARTIAQQEKDSREERGEIEANRSRIAALMSAQRQAAERKRSIDALRARLESLEGAAATLN